jgi:hypothetical protein
MPERNITNADARAIAIALRDEIKREFYSDLGKGVWGYIKKTLFIGLIAVSAYGAALHK